MKWVKGLIIVIASIILGYILLTFSSYKWLFVFLYLLMLFLMYMVYQNKETLLYKDLVQLSTMVQQLIDKDEDVESPLLKDELLSKVQHQVVKLSSSLDYHKNSEQIERQRLEALIGDISHQLKTPLANLKMYVELIGEPEPTKKSFYSAIVQQTLKLEWLIESLMKLSKIESGCIHLRMKEADLNQTVLDAIGGIHLKAKKKGIDIKYKVVKEMIVHDVKWTSEALYNVLDNAVKYSHEHSCIEVEIQTGEMFTKIAIKDQGIGISSEELNHVFKRYYRGAMVHEYEGVGIGLYLSQEIMNRQGGYIYAKSNEEGSTFEINIRN